ncbi:hypothetical protein N9164_15385 [Draconibacterium sp.]|nr:hypothetical protein [Draconibacterium sp.]
MYQSHAAERGRTASLMQGDGSKSTIPDTTQTIFEYDQVLENTLLN